jgi:ligand-binding SRPBCC domain-containing protein
VGYFAAMSVHSLHRLQYIPASIEAVWDFFSNPANLPHITPPDMDFKIVSHYSQDPIYPGQLIEYTLRPLPWISVFWITEITHVQQGKYFVDEQRRGPYSLWHHQHHFKEIPGGVEMTDLVHYQLPLGIIGNWVHSLLVSRRLEDIFRYRNEQVEKRFGKFA